MRFPAAEGKPDAMTEPSGVTFPAAADGQRSTSTTGRAVVAAALRPVDPVAARAAEHETNWRSGYVPHFRRLVEAGLSGAGDWLAVARAGLAAVHDTLALAGPDGEVPLATAHLTGGPPPETLTVQGTGERLDELVLPYRGQRLRGDEIRRLLDDWAARGVVEPSVVEQVEAVLARPDWLRLDGHTVAVLGAGAEMGPLTALLRWGADVAAVDLPAAPQWPRVLDTARTSAGRLVAPARGDPGADLLREPGAVADWLVGCAPAQGRLVVGNYTYADGGTHVLLSAAVDAITARVRAALPDAALSFLATPTDVFAVPREAVEQSVRAYADRSRTAKLLGRPLRTLTRGRLLQRAYRPGADPGICDALAPVQGPNYALAKRIQRWRACVARADGVTVSAHVAPSTRTRSVVRNRALAAAYAGAHRFGVEIFEPATSNMLMAALLVHDLQVQPPPAAHPWLDEARGAVHGGIWRAPYAPRSALGLAAVMGYAAARG